MNNYDHDFHVSSLQRILDKMQDAVMSVSLPDQELIFVSPRFAEVFGYPAEAFLNNVGFFKQIVHPDDLDASMHAMEQGLRDGFVELEHRIIWPDGQVRWLHRRAWVDVDEHDRPIRVNDSARDITQQKEAEAKLREQANILQQVSDAIIATDVDLRITAWNQAAVTIYGWTEAEALGHQLDDLLQTRWHHTSQREAEAILVATGRWQGELQQLARDGTLRYIWASVSWLRDDAGAIIGGIAVNREITARKLMEQEILTQNAILHQSRDLIGLADLQGRIIFLNQAGAQMLGSDDPSTFIGKPINSFYLPEDVARIRNEYLPHALATGMWRGENRLKMPDSRLLMVEQTIFPVRDAGGTIIRLATIIADITERKHAEAILRASEARQQALLNAIPDLILRFHRDGTLLDYHEPANSLLPFKPEIWLGKKTTAFFPEDIAQQHEIVMNQVMASHQPVQYACIWKVGDQPRSYEVYVVPSTDEELLAILRDVTAQKRAEEEHLARQEIEAGHRATNAFLANVSDDIRTPLNAMLGFAQILAEDPSLTPRQHEHVQTIVRNGEYLLMLFTDLLTITRLDVFVPSLHLADVNLHELLHDVEMMFRFRAKTRELVFVVEHDASVPAYARVDGVKLRQALINLASNAVKFTRASTVSMYVHVERTVNPLGGQIEHLYLVIDVEDGAADGAAEEQAYLFDRFWQDRVGGLIHGAGLGFNISLRLIELLGGCIGVKPRGDAGTCMQIWLPLQESTQQLPQRNATELTPDDLAFLPSALVQTMLLDVEQGNMAHLQQMIAQVHMLKPELASKLQALADQYAYEQLSSLLQPRGGVV